LFVFLFCDWKTAWSLYYNSIDETERQTIDRLITDCSAGWLKNDYEPSTTDIERTTRIVSVQTASAYFCLDDPNLTKSLAMACMKPMLTRSRKMTFQNISKNVLNQKFSNLCVPIAVTTLIRYSLAHDLNFNDSFEFSFYRILTSLTMVVYPRSLAGLNLNPKEEETDFQRNDIESLLRRLSRSTFMSPSGWEIIRNINSYNAIHKIERPKKFISSGSRSPSWRRPTSGSSSKTSSKPVDSICSIEKVTLNKNFKFIRPVTLTGAYLKSDGEVFFHQMVLDRIENDNFIIQNTQFLANTGAVLRIPVSNPFYVTHEMACRQYHLTGRYVYSTMSEFMELVNERIGNKEVKKWYLLPQAYSLTFVPSFK